MGRNCSICTHPRLYEIHEALRAMRDTGDTYASLGRKFDVDRRSLRFHDVNHRNTIAEATPGGQIDLLVHVSELRERLEWYEERAERMLSDLEELFDDPSKLFRIQGIAFDAGIVQLVGDVKVSFVADPMLRALSELRKFIESAGKLAETEAAIRIKLEEMRRAERKTSGVESAEWEQLRDEILQALEPFPEAALALRKRLQMGVIVDVTPTSVAGGTEDVDAGS